MTRQILYAIALLGLLSCNNYSDENENVEEFLPTEEITFSDEIINFQDVDTTILMSDDFKITPDNKIPIAITNPSEKIKLIGELGIKLGEVVTVCGVFMEDYSKGYGDGPNLIVQKINGVATQKFIKIPLTPYPLMEFGKHPLPKLENGVTYRFRVYETGEFVGIPYKAYNEVRAVIQTTGFYFQNQLITISGKKVNKLEWTPEGFVGRNALLHGVAENQNNIPMIIGIKWKLKLIDVNLWTESEIGKQVEVYGKVHKIRGQNSYYILDGKPRLVKLEDQLGKNVKLRGTARSTNNYWWFNYRGTDLYVENMNKLPNWTDENHWRPIEITGVLEQAKLPRIDQISLKEIRDEKMYYIVRKASWQPIDELLTPEISEFLKIMDDI